MEKNKVNTKPPNFNPLLYTRKVYNLENVKVILLLKNQPILKLYTSSYTYKSSHFSFPLKKLFKYSTKPNAVPSLGFSICTDGWQIKGKANRKSQRQKQLDRNNSSLRD